jgi:uncharacterized protein YjdB
MKGKAAVVLVGILLCAGCGTGGIDLFGGPGHSIVVQPFAPLLRPGGSMQLTVVRLNHDGTQSTANARDYGWSSSNPSVGTVNRDGLLTGLAVGQTEIACIERGDNRVQAYIVATVDWSAP